MDEHELAVRRRMRRDAITFTTIALFFGAIGGLIGWGLVRALGW